jgi:hypothetical protein
MNKIQPFRYGGASLEAKNDQSASFVDGVKREPPVGNSNAISQHVVRQLYNPLEILTNLVYLVQSEPGDKSKVIEYMNIAEAQVARLSEVARSLSDEAARPCRLEFVNSERLNGDLLIVEFSDGTQTTYTPEDLFGVGGRRRRSDDGFPTG